jgi:hypothetical protein
VAALAVLAVAGCGSAVDVPAAEGAADPGCAEVLVLLRDVDELAGLPRVQSTGQSTAAWASDDRSDRVELRCGVALPAPTTDACVTVDGVDWVTADEQGSPPFTTYGRSPATRVDVTGDVTAGDVLPGLSGAVGALEAQRACV